jgi:rhodanese-related sulfurtransferase
MSVTAIPSSDTINSAVLRELINDEPNLRILDVRTGGEYETVHIPGSYNVPLDTLGEHVKDLADVDHPVVLVCQSGGRATQAHGKLAAAGKETLHILEGGMASWQAAGGDLVQGDSGRWAMDRQVRLVAGSLVLAGVVASAAVPKAKWIAAGVASGLVYSAVSNSCAMASMLAKLPYNKTDKCDIVGVLEDLNREAA